MTNLWDIDVGHSAIHFWVRHMVISKVHGRFAKWSGAIQLDEQDPTRSSVDVRIDTAAPTASSATSTCTASRGR